MPELAVQSNVNEVLGKVADSAAKAMLRAANVARNQILQNISGARHGNVYYVPGTQTKYTASAPGEYPAVATGRLRGDIKYVQEGDAVLIGSTLDYALALEKKPPSAGGREWLRPSLEQAKPDMLKAIGEQWL